jgi:hypothetical protein
MMIKSQPLTPKHEKKRKNIKRERWTYRRRMRKRSGMLGGFIRDRIKDDSGEIRHEVDCFAP